LRQSLLPNPLATLHQSRRNYYRIRKKFYRAIDHGKGEILIHKSVRQRWDQNPDYRPNNLVDYVEANGWPAKLES
jgi:hypothetical protein